MRRDIMERLPRAKQVLAFSATYRSELLDTLHSLMRQPQHVILSTDTLAVQGWETRPLAISLGCKELTHHILIYTAPPREEIQQFYVVVPKGTAFAVFNEKANVLLSIINRLPFQQALVFTNDRSR